MPPSHAYVRSFLYLLYTLIELYYTKALSDPASSLAPIEFVSSGGQESCVLLFSNNLSLCPLVFPASCFCSVSQDHPSALVTFGHHNSDLRVPGEADEQRLTSSSGKSSSWFLKKTNSHIPLVVEMT